MLDLTRSRLHRHQLTATGIDFVHADALEWRPPQRAYDAVVTHFFLDCFPADQVKRLVAVLAEAAKPNAVWLLADFCVPASGFQRIRARLIHQLMYLFFRATCRLPARALSPPDEALQAHGFTLQDRQMSEWGLLHSDSWVRSGRKNGGME